MTARLKYSLHPGMGAAVLSHLGKLVTLPTEGVVAGQAVASALQDLFGRGGGIYNDVDVFVPAWYSTKAEKLVLLPRRFQSRLTEIPSDEGYGEGLNRLVPTTGPTYTIAGTHKDGLLNMVHVRMGPSLGSPYFAPYLLASFDINSTRVAVDIATGRLSWDRHFEQFCRDSILRLCSLHTPFHSLLRLYAKQEQLVDVRTNWDAAHQMVALTREPRMRALLESRNAVSYWFGARYQALAARYRTQLKGAFRVRQQWRYRDESGKVRPGFGDETLPAAELGTLQVLGGLPEDASTSVASSLLEFLGLPKLIYGRVENSRPLYTAVRTWEPKMLAKPVLAAHSQLSGSDYLASLADVAEAKRLALRLQQIGPTLLAGMSAREQLTLLDAGLAYLDSRGVLDTKDVLVSGLSLMATPDVDVLLSYLDDELSRQEKNRAQPVPTNWSLSDSDRETLGRLGAYRKGTRVMLEVLANQREVAQYRARHNLGRGFFFFAPSHVYFSLYSKDDPLQACLLSYRTHGGLLVENAIVEVPKTMGKGRRGALRRALWNLESKLSKQGSLVDWDPSYRPL